MNILNFLLPLWRTSQTLKEITSSSEIAAKPSKPSKAISETAAALLSKTATPTASSTQSVRKTKSESRTRGHSVWLVEISHATSKLTSRRNCPERRACMETIVSKPECISVGGILVNCCELRSRQEDAERKDYEKSKIHFRQFDQRNARWELEDRRWGYTDHKSQLGTTMRCLQVRVKYESHCWWTVRDPYHLEISQTII